MAENFLNMMENIIQKIQETQQISSTKKIKHKKIPRHILIKCWKPMISKILTIDRSERYILYWKKKQTLKKKKKIGIIEIPDRKQSSQEDSEKYL